MTNHDDNYLHVWLISETAAELPLFADVCSMLRLVERSGGLVENVPKPRDVVLGGAHYLEHCGV